MQTPVEGFGGMSLYGARVYRNTRRARIVWRIVGPVLATMCLVFPWVSTALEPGTTVPPVAFNLHKDKVVNLADLRGRVVVVDFWASWCKPCLTALPGLERLSGQYPDSRVLIVAVNVDEEPGKADEIISFLKLKLPVVLDTDHRVVSLFSPGTLPTTYIIDAAGKLRFVHTGYEEGDTDRIGAEIKTLLGEDSPQDKPVEEKQ